MTLKEIKTDEEAIEGREYLVQISAKNFPQLERWTVGTFTNGTLMIEGPVANTYKRIAYYELPE